MPTSAQPPKAKQTKALAGSAAASGGDREGKGRGSNLARPIVTESATPAALALAARMIEQCPDPDRVARDLGAEVTGMAAAMLAGAQTKGPVGSSDRQLIGRILGAKWAQPREAAATKAAVSAELLDALSARLNGAHHGPARPVSVTAAGAEARKLGF